MKNTFLIKMTMVYLNKGIQLQTEIQIEKMVQNFSRQLQFKCGDGPCTARFSSQFSQANWCVRLTVREV